MPKRWDKEFDSVSSPAKRAKIDVPREENERRIDKNTNKAPGEKNYDVWGEDFDDDDIVEVDLVASQACSETVNASLDTRTSSNMGKPVETEWTACALPGPSTSKAPTSKPSWQGGRLHSQKLASSENLKEVSNLDATGVFFQDFQRNLVNREYLNSTFQQKNDVVVSSDETYLKQLEKLKQENKKLLDDFMTKEGETVFLRSQLHQTQLRAENEKMEKARFIEEQAGRHRAEINTLYKEKENLKTQNEFQAMQLGSLMERCKLLESGAIKLTQPQKVVVNDSPSRTRFGSPNRSTVATKSVKVREISAQTCNDHRNANILKTSLHDYPLDRIPQSIFEPCLPEKSVVDIQIMEKIGRKNLPILQEEETFRIFENPVLVKPIVSVVNGRQLNVEFFLPDIALIMKKTRAEINSEDCVPIVNKIVSTTRELLLNSTIVLETILAAMKNDDIRDMNDVYFSDFYETGVEYDKTICDSNAWYEKERGVEARRAMGVLSYVAEASDYTCEYIAGKTRLILERDVNYPEYSKEMKRYDAWKKKDRPFEMLEMILEFVIALGLVRRSHQFSGLICSIVRTLCSVQQRIGFCSKGMEYVAKIYKEIVFSRPLLQCFLPIARMMEIFCKSKSFGRRLCFSRSNMKIWNGTLHFNPDACPLEIFMVQLERFTLDQVTMINMSESFLRIAHLVVVNECIPWITESSNSCNCCMSVLSYAITLLCQSSGIDVGKLENKDRENKLNRYNEYFWQIIKKRQIMALKKGITFLNYLAKREPDFIIRMSDIEDSFHLFMQRVATFHEVALHENEKEALTLIRSTLSPENPGTTETRSQQSKHTFSIKSAFEEKPVADPSSGRWYNVNSGNNCSEETSVYKELLGV